MNDSELSASTAQLARLENAVGDYWNCAYQEGHLNRSDGDRANAILHEIRCAVAALVAAEREASRSTARFIAQQTGDVQNEQPAIQRCRQYGG